MHVRKHNNMCFVNLIYQTEPFVLPQAKANFGSYCLKKRLFFPQIRPRKPVISTWHEQLYTERYGLYY